MKLKAELPNLLAKLKGNEDKIIKYREELRATGNYNNFEVRFAHDVLTAFLGTKYLCSLYGKYDCHDSHMTTLGITALKQLGLL